MFALSKVIGAKAIRKSLADQGHQYLKEGNEQAARQCYDAAIANAPKYDKDGGFFQINGRQMFRWLLTHPQICFMCDLAYAIAAHDPVLAREYLFRAKLKAKDYYDCERLEKCIDHFDAKISRYCQITEVIPVKKPVFFEGSTTEINKRAYIDEAKSIVSFNEVSNDVRKQRCQQAITYLDIAIKQAPRYAAAWRLKAYILSLQATWGSRGAHNPPINNLKEQEHCLKCAIVNYEKAQQTQPLDAESEHDLYLAYCQYGKLLCQCERYDEALAYIGKALVLNPESSEAQALQANASAGLGISSPTPASAPPEVGDDEIKTPDPLPQPATIDAPPLPTPASAPPESSFGDVIGEADYGELPDDAFGSSAFNDIPGAAPLFSEEEEKQRHLEGVLTGSLDGSVDTLEILYQEIDGLQEALDALSQSGMPSDNEIVVGLQSQLALKQAQLESLQVEGQPG